MNLLKSLMRISLLVIVLLSIFQLSLMGCSMVGPKHDPALQVYVKQFSNIVNVKEEELQKYTIRFLSSPEFSDVVGTCYYGFDWITIDPRYFYLEAKPLQKMSLIYHEIAHCYCDSRHDNRLRKNGCPVSLMYESTITRSCLQNHWLDYLKDLKEKCDG